VPIRKLAKSVEIAQFSLGPSPFDVMPWSEGSWWARWLQGAPVTLQVESGGLVRRFLTPDSDLAMTRLRSVLPMHSRTLE
jgi:hypothetical protein